MTPAMLRLPHGTVLSAALLLGLVTTTAVEAQQPQPRQQGRQQQPTPPPQQRPAAVALAPAEQRQLELDVNACWNRTEPANLERACTNSISKQNSIVNLDATSLGWLHYNRANARIASGNNAGAIDDFNKAIAGDYNPHAAHTQLGFIYLERQPDLVRAEASYRAALNLNPGFRDARVGLALTLLRKRDATGKIDTAAAVREINTALEANPADAELHYHKGAALSQGTSVDDAVKSLDEALRLRPGYIAALFLRGQININRGQRTRAIEDFNAIAATSPNDSQTLASLGATLTQLKQYDRAIQVCERAVQIDVKNVTAHVCLGLARTDQGLIPKALEDFERALQWNTASAEAYIGRGYLHKRTGNFDSAIADFKKALDIDRRSADAQRHLISVYTDKGELDKALLAFEEANNINRNDPWNFYLRSFVFALRNDAARAKKDIEQAFTLVGNSDTEAYLARGAMNYFLNDAASAIRDARNSIRFNADNGQSHKLLARALLKQRDLRGAETSLKRAQELLLNDWNVQRTWGLLEFARNNHTRAKEHFERSIDLNPAFIEAYVGLGRVYEALGNADLAKSQYQLGQTKLDYDIDGREAREDAKRRLAALVEPKVAVAPPTVLPTPTKKEEPKVAVQTPPRQPPPAAKKDEPRVPGSQLTPVSAPPTEPTVPSASGGLNTPPTSGRQPDPARTQTAEGPQGEALLCRLLKGWATHARDYAGVQLNVGCREP